MTVINYFTSDINNGPMYFDTLKLNFEKLLKGECEKSVFRELSGYKIKDIVFGPYHIGILTECGLVCRVPITEFDVEAENNTNVNIENNPLTTENTEIIDNSSNVTDDPPPIRSSSINWRRYTPSNRPGNSYVDFLLSSDHYNFGRRGRPFRVNSSVPESLIEQVQNILQSHSRSSIIRELLRSNLNLNVAVNSLLAREEGHSSNRIHESLGNIIEPLSRREHARLLANSNIIEKDEKKKTKKSKKNMGMDKGKIEWINNGRRFKCIGSMHSDMVLIDIEGNLMQWEWNIIEDKVEENDNIKNKCYCIKHKKIEQLKLENEKFIDIKCSTARCIALTESNKVLTLMDRKLWGVSQLEGCRYINYDKRNVKIIKIDCNNSYSVVILEDGSVYWWGVYPYSQRSKILSKGRKNKTNTGGGDVINKEKMPIGSVVTTISNSLYQCGSLAFYADCSILKMGKLSEQLTNLKSFAKFNELHDENNEKIDDTNLKKIKVTKKVSKSSKKAKLTEKKECASINKSNEVTWPLNNVIFINESCNNIGVVVKVDKDNVLVEFEREKLVNNSSGNNVGETCQLKNTRIYNIKELKIVKRIPKRKHNIAHCVDIPRKLKISKQCEILGMNTNCEGIYLVCKKNNQIFVDFITPGSKSIKTTRLDGSICKLFLSLNINSINLKIHKNCIKIDIPNYGVYIISKDIMNNYKLANLPSFSRINYYDFYELYSKSGEKYTLSMFVFNSYSYLTKDEIYIDMDNIYNYVYDMNILHFMGELYLINERTYENKYINMLEDKLKAIFSMDKNIVKKLLTSTDCNNLTPLIYGIKIRTYKFCINLMKYILKEKNNQLILDSTQILTCLYYNNPIYLLCLNENCTFTWTNSIHTVQEVYECRTCGIVDKLCCCSDCINICHRNHDVSAKLSSPTAFCDCWELYHCECLYSGDQKLRRKLLKLLLYKNILLINLGCGSEHLMLYIIKTISRHNKEYSEYKKQKSDVNNFSKNNTTYQSKKLEREQVLGNSIIHIKRPSKFLSYAVLLLLKTKESILSLFTNITNNDNTTIIPNDSCKQIPYFLSYFYLLPTQTSGKFFDCFIYSLFSSSRRTFRDSLYNTLKTHFGEKKYSSPTPSSSDNAELNVLPNFIRSCARVYVAITSLMSPFLFTDVCLKNYKSELYKVLKRCIFFFDRFPYTSLKELSNIAFSIIKPIMMGQLNQKTSNFPLFGRMSDVNDFVSKFFLSISTTSNKSSKKNTARSSNTRQHTQDSSLYMVDDLLTDENLTRGTSRNDHYYSEDDDDDDDDDDDEEEESESITDANVTNAAAESNDDDDHTNRYIEIEESDTFDDISFTVTSEGGGVTIDDTVQGIDHAHTHHHNQEEISNNSIVSIDDDDDSTSYDDEDDEQINQQGGRQDNNINSTNPPFIFPYTILSHSDHRIRSNRFNNINPTFAWAVRGNNLSDMRNGNESIAVVRAGGIGESSNEILSFQTLSIQCGLARSFSIVVKLISDLIIMKKISTNYIESIHLNDNLGKAFLWLFDMCDSFETKIRFGLASLTTQVSSLQPGRWDYEITYNNIDNGVFSSTPSSNINTNILPTRRRRNDEVSNRVSTYSDRNRSDLVSILMSILRSNDNEHFGVLPYVDLNSSKHIAYILDSYIYYLNAINICQKQPNSTNISYYIPRTLSYVLKRNKKWEFFTDHFYSRTCSVLFLVNKQQKLKTNSTFSHQLAQKTLDNISKTHPVNTIFNTSTTITDNNDLPFSTDEHDQYGQSILNMKYNFNQSFILENDENKQKMIVNLLRITPNILFIRWHNLINMYSEIFLDSVGLESSSIYRELSSFEAKEVAFTYCMEKLRSVNTHEISFDSLDRKPSKLLIQTFKLLNTQLYKREFLRSDHVVSFSRVKAMFRNEPGEGSGVTRNFFSVLSQAILSPEPLPDLSSIIEIYNKPLNNDEAVQFTTTSTSIPTSSTQPPLVMPYSNNQSSLPIMHEIIFRGRSDMPPGTASRVIRRHVANVSSSAAAQHGQMRNQTFRSARRGSTANLSNNTTNNIQNNNRANIQPQVQNAENEITLSQIEELCQNPNTINSQQINAQVSMKFKKFIKSHSIELTNKIVDGLLQLSPDVLYNCIIDENFLQKHIDKIVKLYGDYDQKEISTNNEQSNNNNGNNKNYTFLTIDNSVYPENAPLFYQPNADKNIYFPVNAKKTFARLNAYRNVGRILALALFSREVIPIILCRSVVKFLLNRPISFDDFAFFDPIQYESLKQLHLEAEQYHHQNPTCSGKEMHGLTFCLNIYDSNKNPHTIDLVPDGSSISVTTKNVHKYIQSYVEYLLIYSVLPELTSLREGLYEIMHPFPLSILSSEDFRLIINGASEISIDVLKKFVEFTDETGQISKDRVIRFKQWFWQILTQFNQSQRSELLQFWTSSPLLNIMPHSPRPNITLRPLSSHLPTSNTCVLRLYLPLYKKKSVLRDKILMAIKTKTFGFI